MKKKYNTPIIRMYELKDDLILCSSNLKPGWEQNEDGDLINPGGHKPPGHNKSSEYRTNIWED